MSRREFFGSGGYFWATVIATPRDESLASMLAVESGGLPFVARPSQGHMMRTNTDPNSIEWRFPVRVKGQDKCSKDGCGKDARAHIEGEWLCQNHATEWSAGEGIAAQEFEQL